MLGPAPGFGLVASLVRTYLVDTCLGWFVDPRVFWAVEWCAIAVVVCASLCRDFREHPAS